MGDPGPAGASNPQQRAARVGFRTLAVVLAATIVPVASLLWASVVARTEVEQRALHGLTATAKATVLQQQQAWDDAIRAATSAATRPVSPDAVGARDVTLARLGVENILASGPFATVRLYDAGGELVAMAALPGASPTPVRSPDTGPTFLGDPVTEGPRTSRQISLPAGLGRLVVDVDVTQLLGRPSGLAFGKTGTKILVTPAGTVVAGSSGVGEPLQASQNRALAAAGQPATAVVFTPYYQRVSVESYEPIPGQNMGILVVQARSEVMEGADRLVARLRWVAAAVAILGVLLGAVLAMFLARRSRRLATSERQLASSQAASRRRLEQFLDAMPIGVFVATADGRPHYANREAERVLGRGIVPGAGPDELAEVYQAIVTGTGEPYPSGRMPLFRALNGETSHIDDMELLRPHGNVPIEVWGTPVCDADGAVEFGITAFADVSDRRRAEEETQLLAAIVQASSEAILAKTLDGIVTSWNHGAESLFGYTAAEMVGGSIDVLVPDRGKDEESGLRARVARGLGVAQYEAIRLHKDGSIVHVATSLSPITGVDGRVTGIATLCRDIGERKRAEAAILEREKLLAAARDQAIEASSLKSRFLSNTSHEIRTPMTVIVGNNELLLDTELDPTQRRFADAVSRGCASLLAVVSDILDFSKIEAGRLDLDVADVELRPMLEEITAAMADVAGEKGLRLTCAWPADLPDTLLGDGARLRQVLLNLVSNAVKFTAEGYVELRAGRRSGPGSAIRFEVVDSGIGIAQEDKGRLFQPFSQIDGSDIRVYGGTGLGLAICKQLVEAMGGRIGVESSAGVGSTFWFEIPCEEPAALVPALPALVIAG